MKELKYTQVGDYLFLGVEYPEEQYEPLGKYGMLHETYLKNHKKRLFDKLVLSNKLMDYLHEIDKQASEMVERLIQQQLKVDPAPNRNEDPIGWAYHMMRLKEQAEEIVLNDIVYN